MSFKIKIARDAGKFSVELKDDITFDQMRDIVNVAEAILTPIPKETPLERVVSQEKSETTFTTASLKGQTKIGEFPINKLEMGTYIEPDEGVRLKIVHFLTENRVAAFKAMRDLTGIPAFGCKDILYGNFLSPIFSVEVADKLIEKFKPINFFVKLEPATKGIRAA